MEIIKTHFDLRVYQLSFKASMEIFESTKLFPKSEVFSLTDQIRRSSRSVSGNLAEAFRKRMYTKSFVHKISDSEGEAAETQVWLQYAYECNYLEMSKYRKLMNSYDQILGMLVLMRNNP
jgi:four helix bundle protein